MTRLCFDYGHGGKDPGAIYKNRYESHDNLDIGTKVAQILRGNGIMVDETRTKDITLSLWQRIRFENAKDYDYFISFHRNAFKPETARGVETYIYLTKNKKALTLAKKIQKNLSNVGFINRGVRLGNYYVLRNTKAPALLIELGFIDNTLDNSLFDEKRDEIANSIARSIIEVV